MLLTPFPPICFSSSATRLELRGYKIEALSTMKSVCYKRQHMPVFPPQWQMPHPKADRRHCSLCKGSTTQSNNDGSIFLIANNVEIPFAIFAQMMSGSVC